METIITEILNSEGKWVEGFPSENGQQYRERIVFSVDEEGNPLSQRVSVFTYQVAPEITTYFGTNEAITVGGQPLQGLNNVYYAPVGVEIQLQAEIVDNQGVIQIQIDQATLGYPPVLKMPVVKLAGGLSGTVVDEIYFTVTLVNGVLTATGTLPNSGDWKLLTSRLNQSLQSIGADWKVERPNTTFLA